MQLARYRRNDDAPAPLGAPSSGGPVPTQTRERLLALTGDWRRDSAQGAAFVQALDAFFAGISNPNTRRAYAYTLLEFWDWLRANTGVGIAPTPERVERVMASQYAEWLRSRSHGIERFRLEEAAAASRAGRSPTREPEVTAETYVYLLDHPGSDILAIRAHLLRSPARAALEAIERGSSDTAVALGELDKLLACLTERRVLSRTPTLRELRASDPTLMRRLGERIDPTVFRYSVPEKPGSRGDRVSTVAQRLAILSSFWDHLINRSGENTGPDRVLIKYNVWTEPLRASAKGVSSHQDAVQARTTPDIELFERILATTSNSSSFKDLRDRAVLLFLRWTGVRATELGTLRRRDIHGQPPQVTVRGKGGKTRVFQVPTEAMEVLELMSYKVVSLAEATERAQPGIMPRSRAMLEPDAPLFPALKRWGCNATSRRALDNEGLSQSAFAIMFARRAEEAGIVRGSDDWRRVHMHGWRHMSARDAITRGVPLNVLQGILGHESLATTDRYVKIMNLERFSLGTPPAAPQRPVEAAPAPAPRPVPSAPPPVAARPVVPTVSAPVAPPAPKPMRRIVDTVGVTVQERAPAPAVSAPPPPPPPAAPPPVPASQRLVAIGEVAPLSGPLPSTLEMASADKDALSKAYAGDGWGEQKAKRGREAVREGARKEIAGGEVEDDLLAHAYRARVSGLVWWGGPSGALRPEMPVMAPSQILEGSEPGSVVLGLEELWATWVDNQALDPKGMPVERGPTAARALLQWVRVALQVMEQVEGERIEHKASWVPFSAPLSATEVKPKEPWSTLRVHRDDRVVRWFEARAFTFMTALGRVSGEKAMKKRSLGQVVDTGSPETGFGPAGEKGTSLDWYGHADPVAELPPEERAELLDWLSALTGQAPKDPTKRFPRTPDGTDMSLSRIDLSRLLGTICTYDITRDDLGELERTGGDRESIDMAKETMVTLAAEAKKQVKALSGGAVPDFDLAKRVKARGAANWDLQEQGAIRKAKAELGLEDDQADEEKGEAKAREGRRDFRMKILAELFGPAAGKDELLRLQALCGKAPLSGALLFGGDYKKLFATDKARTTIVHDPAFAKEFAAATGSHSECVARRIARHLWEIRKAGATRLDRGDELSRRIDNWAYMAVPCPAPLERELKDRLAGAKPTPLRTEVEREHARIRSGQLVPLTETEAFDRQLAAEEQAALLAGTEEKAPEDLFSEGSGFGWVKNGKNRKLGRYLKNARSWVPSPILLLVWAHLR